MRAKNEWNYMVVKLSIMCGHELNYKKCVSKCFVDLISSAEKPKKQPDRKRYYFQI